MKFRILAHPSRTLWTLALITVAINCWAQTPEAPRSYPNHLPYTFSNFVWWNNDELRTLLKSRMPGLGDEIALGSPIEHRMRDVLTTMLKEKGVVAEVQSIEPSAFSFTAEHAPGAPPPGIVYTILSPPILVGAVIVSGVPETISAALDESLRGKGGNEYSGNQDWMIRSSVQDGLAEHGYLDGEVKIAHDLPRRSGNKYLVNLLVTVNPGPQYHVDAITADGGPLLEGRELSSYFVEKPGDIARVGPSEGCRENFVRSTGIMDTQMWKSMGRPSWTDHAPRFLTISQ